MSRPKPLILLSKELSDVTGIDILNAVSLYAVLYRSQPINIKHRHFCISGENNKYSRTVFTSCAPAENLAKKLNTEFNTLDFGVRQIL